MDGRHGNDVSAVFLIEIVEVRGVLEVVGVAFAVFNDIIGDDIIGEYLYLKRDLLCGKEAFGYLKDLGMRCGGSGNGDLGACKGSVVDRGIIAVGGGVYGAYNCAVVLLGDKLFYLIAFKSRLKSLDSGSVFVSFLHGKNVGVSGVRAFDSHGIFGGIERSGDRVVGVDNGKVNILEDVGKRSSFYFSEFDVVGVFNDISYGGGYAGAFFELDKSVGFKQEKRARFVGGIVGYGNFYVLIAAA